MGDGQHVPVPFFDLKLQYEGLYKPIEEALARVLGSGQYILGPEVAALEEEFAAYCGTAQAIACSSGTEALLLALKAIGIGKGDEVIVPPFTFFSSASAVCRVGATPVFADIDPATFNLDAEDVSRRITPRTRAVMPVHLFGQCVDMEPLWHLAEKHRLVLVEDAAQAVGSEYQGKRTGTLGGIACFSFYPTKNLGAFGDAGMVVTNDCDWAARVRRLRVHGMEPKYLHREIGWNSRLDAIQAAILRVKLPWLNRFIDARRAIARRYDHLIEEHGLTELLVRPTVQPQQYHSFNQYVVRVTEGRRDDLARFFKSRGIGYEIYYPYPLHLQEAFRHLGYGPGDFPVAERACHEVLAFPMFPELTFEEQRRVVETCAEFQALGQRLAA